MRWSKVRQLAEANFTEALQGRVRLNVTHLRKTHDDETRGTILVDDEVWLDACYFKHMQAYRALQDAGGPDWDAALPILDRQGLIQGWRFQREVFDFLNMPIETALEEGTTTQKVLAVLDRRIGKRRFKAIEAHFADHPVVARFVALRLSEARPMQPSNPGAGLAA